ncbi:MAG: NUDIX domain-containing protein [Halieaceae bacterium]|jgi:ADP-ribose pyrophosphatase YjhB (NUDIX family)|nr:NUDIX domain-containing protein [Halieaceae bacterium]
MKYCPECGAGLERHRVAGEPRGHWFCQGCGVPRFDHPMVVVTCFVTCGKRLLWVKRDLEPKRGLWAIPGGYLESGETLAQGAARELSEEAGIVLPPQRLTLYMTGTITFINQVYVGFRAAVETTGCTPGVESQDCGFFTRDDCPWDEVAYPEVNDSIRQVYDDLDRGSFGVWQAQMSQSRYLFEEVSQGIP